MIKIEDVELKEINDLRVSLAETITEVGNLTLQKNLTQQEIIELEQNILSKTEIFKKLLENEKQLVKRLSEKYGVGSINFETGEFTAEN